MEPCNVGSFPMYSSPHGRRYLSEVSVATDKDYYVFSQLMMTYQGKKLLVDIGDDKRAAGVTEIHCGPLIDNHSFQVQGVTKPDHQTQFSSQVVYHHPEVKFCDV